MTEHTVRDKGVTYMLSGIHRAVGDEAPSFTVQAPSPRSDGQTTWTPLDPMTTTTVILSVPSLDTPVCDMEASVFADRAGEIPHARLVVVSTDLPYAQARWLRTKDISNVWVGSDHLAYEFCDLYGVLIQPLAIATRAAFVVSPGKRIVYVAYMPELNQQVDFDEIIAAAKGAA